MPRNKKYPTEFLGRCQHCLDNAYLDGDCVTIGHPDCRVRRAREMFKPAAPAAPEAKE